MNEIIPTIFAHSESEFKKRFSKVNKLTKSIQIDFMDGVFVQGVSVSLKKIPNLKKEKGKFEAHIMVKNPEKWIDELANKGFKKLIFHVEANPQHIRDIIKKIKLKKMEPWLAINPETSISAIIPHIHSVSGILFMGVYPGRENQDFIPKVYEKIVELREFNREIKIQVDGGVNEEVAKRLKRLGVNALNTGSFVSGANNPEKALRKLEMAFS